MSIYSIVDLLGGIMAFYCVFCYNNYNIKSNNKAVFLFLFLWTILVAFRGYGVGNDTSGYAFYFSGKTYPSLVFTNYGTVNNPVDEIEIGFVLLTKILSFVSSSPTFLFSVVSILFFSAIYRFYRNNKFGIIAILWLFTSTYSMMNIVYALRQCFSLGIFFWGIIVIECQLSKNTGLLFLKKKTFFSNYYVLLGLFLVLLSLFVHRTSALVLVIYILAKFCKVNKLISISVVSFCFVFSLFSISTIIDYFNLLFVLIGGVNNFDILARYQDSMEISNVSFLNLASFALPCIVTIVYSSKEEINKSSFKFYLIAVCLYLMFCSSPFVARFIVAFWILGYPAAIPTAISKNKNLLVFYVLMTCFYLWKMVSQYANWPIKISSDLPYMFFWE